MEVALHRVDLMHCQAMSQGTMVILPQGKKKQQKVAVGDDSGVLTVFYMKKGEVQVEWKAPAMDREIASVVLQSQTDKIFVGSGQTIHGFTRKGKEFVKIKTNLTETINHLFVHESMIWTGGEYIMNIYDQCKDFGFVLVKDRINDLTCAPIAPGDILSTVIACQDKYLRVYAGEKPYLEFSVEGPGTALGFYGPAPAKDMKTPVSMVYGTEQGIAGMVNIDSKGIKKALTIADRHTRPGVSGSGVVSRRARVCAVHCADLVKSGCLDFLVGRDDGQFEVWSTGSDQASAFSSRSEEVPPSLVFEACLKESIQSMDSGNVTGSEHNEVVLTTFGGKVLSFTQCQAARDPTGAEIAQVEEGMDSIVGSLRGSISGEKRISDLPGGVKGEKERRFKVLENEVEQLKAQLQREKQGYKKMSNEQIAVQTTTKVSHRFNLNSEEACYVLTLESETPLELITIRSDVEVDLLDHDGTPAILSRSKGDTVNPVLATYRMQEQGARFQVRLRTIEGMSGTISCFVVPQTKPKTAHLVTLAVKPLSLHEKLTEMPPDVPMSELRLTGLFTVTDMHQWIKLCVNEMPERPSDDEMVITYRSTFVGTVLHGRYTKGTATFRSDSITTISLLKDLITREATARKIQLSINIDVKDETLPRFLQLIDPKLAFQHSLTQQVRMVEPLREVQLQEGETGFLAPELQMVLEHASDIQQQFELQPQRLAFLHNIVHSAYRHKWQLRGHQSVQHRSKDLQTLLEAYNLEQLIAFFDEPVD